MIHEPRALLNCKTTKDTKTYSRQLQQETQTGDVGYPTYRKRKQKILWLTYWSSTF